MAPEDVPQITGNGCALPRGMSLAMARIAPTWYAARAPPPDSTRPVTFSPCGMIMALRESAAVVAQRAI